MTLVIEKSEKYEEKNRNMSGGDSGFLQSDAQALGWGLLFGDDKAFSPGFSQLVQAVGVTHLVAASGANLRFILALPEWAINRFSWRWYQGLSVVVVLWYWGAAHQSGSLWRATLMWGLSWLSLWWGRPVLLWWTWLVSTVITWLLDTTWLSHSYWLSSLAILGLTFSQKFFSDEKNNRLLTYSENRMKKWSQAWFVGGVIFACVAGYLWQLFQSFEPVGVATTFLLDPMIPIYLGVSAACLVFAWVVKRIPTTSLLESFSRGVQNCLFVLVWGVLRGVQIFNHEKWLSRLTFGLTICCLIFFLRTWWRQRQQRQRWRQVVCH